MARYIDIDKAIDILLMTKDFCFCPKDEKEYEEVDCGKYTGVGDCPECWIQHNVEDVAPVVHAKWDVMFGADVHYYCTNCWKKRLEKTNYCPNCGAKMDKE